MISTLFVVALAAGAAHSAVVPTAPGPGQSFNEGADCTLSWNLDTTGTWTSFNVDLMSGSNLAMHTVTNVFKARDGTKGDTSFTWPCPKVDPHSTIYFYQFSQAGADTSWTTRFAIASPTGQLTPPANATQPGGAAIPWGIGRLAGATASSTNDTVAAPTTAPSTPASTTPPPSTSSTNITTALGGNNSTAAPNTTPATTPKQPTTSSPAPTVPTTSTPNKAPTTPNTATTSKTNTTASLSSDATLLASSKVIMAVLAVVPLFLVS